MYAVPDIEGFIEAIFDIDDVIDDVADNDDVTKDVPAIDDVRDVAAEECGNAEGRMEVVSKGTGEFSIEEGGGGGGK